MYKRGISEATGCTDANTLAALEDIMRHEIFHSTLDWQSREQLADAARLALEMYCTQIAGELGMIMVQP